MNNTRQNVPRGKKPFIKPELRAVCYTPEEVVLAGCKNGTPMDTNPSANCAGCAILGS